MTSPSQKGEREEALEAEVERLSEINRQLVAEYNTLLVELVRRDNKAAELSARLLSSSKAEGEMREALEAVRRELVRAIRIYEGDQDLNLFDAVEKIDAALSPKESA